MPDFIEFSHLSGGAQDNFTLDFQAGIVAPDTRFQQFSDTPCPNCKNSRVNLVRMSEGCKHWAARRCGACDCFLGLQPKPKNTIKRSQQQELINQLLESAQLTHWEREFLQGLKGKRKLSPKQQEVLAKIEAQLGGAQ